MRDIQACLIHAQANFEFGLHVKKKQHTDSCPRYYDGI